MDYIDDSVVKPLTQFVRNSRMLVTKCDKPNYAQFMNSSYATAIGFLVMGGLGFFVKLIFIPINNVILGA